MRFQKAFVILIFLFSTSFSNSQGKENNISELMFVNWIESTVDYIQQNKDVLDARLFNRLSNLMINSFYPYPREEDKLESFKGTIVTFLDNNYPLKFGKEKFYFFQKLSPHGHPNSNDYLILDNENNLKILFREYDGKTQWNIKKTSKFNYKEFEDKFSSLKKFQKCENKNEGGFFYYLITEFDGQKIDIKFIDISCNMKL